MVMWLLMVYRREHTFQENDVFIKVMQQRDACELPYAFKLILRFICASFEA